MSNSKPHRRLALTQPSASLGTESDTPLPTAPDEVQRLRDQVAEMERGIARLEDRLAALAPVGAAPFRVSDADGRLLMEVSGGADGACLRLFDAQGRPLAVLTAESPGGGLGILSGTGQLVATLCSHPEGGGLSILNAHGAVVGTLKPEPEGGALTIRDRHGRASALLAAGDDGGRLEINAPEGGDTVLISVQDTGGGLPLDDPEPLPRGTSAPRRAGDGPPVSALSTDRGLSLYSRDGRKAVAVYAEGASGSVRVYDQLGSCVYSRQ